MAYIKPVINAACKRAQLKRLDSQSKVSKITLNQAITQTQFILEHAGSDRIAKLSSGRRKTANK